MPDLADACDVSVVVPTRNRAPLLRASLESLVAQCANGVRYEVLVVDNNSTDDTAQTVAALSDAGRIRYLVEPREGPSHARNRGVEESTAPIVAFADDDVRVSESWVLQVHSILNRYADVDCVGGRVLPEWPHDPPNWVTRIALGPTRIGRLWTRSDSNRLEASALPPHRQHGGAALRDGGRRRIRSEVSQVPGSRASDTSPAGWSPMPVRSRARGDVTCRCGATHQGIRAQVVPAVCPLPSQNVGPGPFRPSGRRAYDSECAPVSVSKPGRGNRAVDGRFPSPRIHRRVPS